MIAVANIYIISTGNIILTMIHLTSYTAAWCYNYIRNSSATLLEVIIMFMLRATT
jgi:hypothetical protein